MEQRLTEDRRQFSGRVTADLSHDINNVLAILGELSGFLEDLAKLGPAEEGVSTQKVRELTGRISAQLERGKGLVTLLNRFAHSGDDADATHRLADTLRAALELSARAARLRRIAIETGRVDETLCWNGRLHDLLHLLFRCVELRVQAAPPEETIIVHLDRDGAKEPRCRVTVEGGTTDTAADPKSKRIADLAAAHGGTLASTPATNDKRAAITLILPCNQAD